MESIENTVYSEIFSGEGQNSWQSLFGRDDDDESVFGVGQGSEGETNLFALTSELSWLGEKAEEVERFLQSESHHERHQANSALNSIICQVITTSTSILSQCQLLSSASEEVIEMEETEILAEQSHLCSICGKEFRRDGNVRIHMRSHGEPYKSQKTLISSRPKDRRSSYSCPFQGCRYNKRHPSFKRLKSMVSLRNHYRRSHCAKMYTCNNCGKEFSFVGDLKTHGNKCGHSTWQCSCSLTFSTRNKLLRHVALGRHGHKPVLSAPVATSGHGENSSGDKKTPEHCDEDFNVFAVQDSPILTESPPGFGSDEDVLMMGVGSNSIEENVYGYDQMENEFTFSGEDSELYASLFWQPGDLLWP
ncbi:hypothetical protein SUGI_0195740 [Cryptomeria japonica]|uniref:zinc finger protein GAI-ASSOCIATED FACTOR 1-like n=1 Tax=Cryptomeria japonica TaxID=3369 RepID=UPI002408B8AE|nr:zinc finger protein GAI-ASSOCIATED FACTOR 1-like [Cryptomeria japonica]GLJ12684.1 hypothetical protein SUGI_0195740 [Cryptomeria japonica]